MTWFTGSTGRAVRQACADSPSQRSLQAHGPRRESVGVDEPYSRDAEGRTLRYPWPALRLESRPGRLQRTRTARFCLLLQTPARVKETLFRRSPSFHTGNLTEVGTNGTVNILNTSNLNTPTPKALAATLTNNNQTLLVTSINNQVFGGSGLNTGHLRRRRHHLQFTGAADNVSPTALPLAVAYEPGTASGFVGDNSGNVVPFAVTFANNTVSTSFGTPVLSRWQSGDLPCCPGRHDPAGLRVHVIHDKQRQPVRDNQQPDGWNCAEPRSATGSIRPSQNSPRAALCSCPTWALTGATTFVYVTTPNASFGQPDAVTVFQVGGSQTETLAGTTSQVNALLSGFCRSSNSRQQWTKASPVTGRAFRVSDS